MVARKPVPEKAGPDPAAAPAPLHILDIRQQMWSATDSEPDSIWGDEQSHRNDSQKTGVSAENVPGSLRPGGPGADYTNLEHGDNIWANDVPVSATIRDGALRGGDGVNRVPTVLRPGPGGQKHAAAADIIQRNETGPGINQEVPSILRPGAGALKPETNPFKRKMSLSASGASSQEDLGKSTSHVAAPSYAPPLPPVPPLESFSQLSVPESSKNPWQPALDEKRGSTAPSPPALEQDTGKDIWDSAKPSREATPGPRSNSPTLLSLPSEGSAAWEEEEPQKAPPLPPLIPLSPTVEDDVLVDSHAWDDLGTVNKGKGPANPSPRLNTGNSNMPDDWNLIDVEGPPGSLSKQSTWENFDDQDGSLARSPPAPENKQLPPIPPLPPRRSQEVPPPQPPRAVEKSETYQIKNINWHDVKAAKNPRTSPILLQNANGPCPLVALVNALSLTTPADKTNTDLVAILRSREQVSIGLLLDAVVDELLSDRRMKPDVPLPDVFELHEFLKGLHTGMNVNPRYVPTPETVNRLKRTSLNHVHPTERGDLIPGTFEDTKEMALYATFSIPLIHGWLPSRDDDVYDSFTRQAVSYEDAQNLLFREEELEEKLSSAHHQGLTEEEQQIYQDILTIKSFLIISATQLTPWGLEVIRKSLTPGTFAILFRNDHFSTLYRHPQTLELLTLVTDAGYANHAEVVWESLVDVNGERAEFFSGDFRLVGGASHSHTSETRPESSAARNNGSGSAWQTVPGGSREYSHQSREELSNDVSSTEQEDRDLALALQLQEEEDERHRSEQERRRRESRLSEQFIEQQGRPTPAGPRGGDNINGRGNPSVRGGSTINVGRGGSRTSLATPAPATPGRRSSGAVSVPATMSTSSTGTSTNSAGRGGSTSPAASRARPTVQTVRSLIPPRNTNRGPEDGLDDAPPSYEQAAQQAAYVPAPGHPAHPASSPRGEGPASPATRPPTLAPPVLLPVTATPSPSNNGRGRTVSGAAYPGNSGGRGIRPHGAVTPATVGNMGSHGSGRDRECIVM
ncbi:hypothetical protein B0H63DRAFT_393379 [Podospora didyma]|uniref:MINDY deubiquitinase domain-containing protein n=1 Tax=Podospora didyma TaxID=330526 RepID=A0AAE0NSH4_9PEZI|nr:hypothetical protein B0H63DRAFT_393379 [Podospora didyma]